MQNPKDDVLYASVEWVDHSEGYTDIRFHKSTDGIATNQNKFFFDIIKWGSALLL